jgi:hypothetical protein
MQARNISAGPYKGRLVEAFDTPAVVAFLADLDRVAHSDSATVLAEGRDRTVRVDLPRPDGSVPVVVKAFVPQSGLGRWLGGLPGSRAARSFESACALLDHGVGTPAPVACLERVSPGGQVTAGVYVCVFAGSHVSFARELSRLFREDPECWKFMALLHTVARGIRAMHDAGFLHRDLGNQNVLIRRAGDGQWSDVLFIDLNRGRMTGAPGPADRGHDIARIHLPSDLRRVFLEMYWEPEMPPSEFLLAEERCRRRYAWHHATRALRHPFRERRRAGVSRGEHDYPAATDQWIWDERSGQPIVTMRSRDRHRNIPASVYWRQAAAVVRSGPAVWRAYRELLGSAFSTPVPMGGRVGVALDPRRGTFDREFDLWRRLGAPPALVRFYAHETAAACRFRCEAVERIATAGGTVTAALVQDRRAVRDPGRWRGFLTAVLEAVGARVEAVEVGHAINRVKWGIWTFGEYRRLLEATSEVMSRFPAIRAMGPAGIDFEYPFVAAALRQVPAGMRFDALSHHLYVDRRGAPENRQGPFSTLEKCALARAVGRASGVCGDRLVISEANWPLLGTGVYSPVGAPYESPGPRRNDPSVSEDDYADYMIRYFLLTVASGLSDRVFWWRLVARGYGLVDDSTDPWRERPAFEAMRRFLAYTNATEFVRRMDFGGGASACVFRGTGGREVALAYTTGPVAEVPIPGAVEAEDIVGKDIPVVSGRVRLSGRPVWVRLADSDSTLRR